MKQKRCGEDGTCCGSPTGCRASDDPLSRFTMYFFAITAPACFIVMMALGYIGWFDR